ncbi:hypothetical protein WN51_07626 [Melipona quadrifasciata]|uniref:Uncharacterized protein n=1 Tax=Melipona quadrifasciata TaxID=166423 RepID=A0A0N0U2Y7_9HYME|nr:hypothetical protein WN51_07626 [Melipona quadrifasciata]
MFERSYENCNAVSRNFSGNQKFLILSGTVLSNLALLSRCKNCLDTVIRIKVTVLEIRGLFRITIPVELKCHLFQVRDARRKDESLVDVFLVSESLPRLISGALMAATAYPRRWCRSYQLDLSRPRIPQIRVSNSGCAPSVDVLPIFDVKQQSVRNPARMGGPALVEISDSLYNEGRYVYPSDIHGISCPIRPRDTESERTSKCDILVLEEESIRKTRVGQEPAAEDKRKRKTFALQLPVNLVSSATDKLQAIAMFDVEIAPGVAGDPRGAAVRFLTALLLETSDQKSSRKLSNSHDHQVPPSKSLLRKPRRELKAMPGKARTVRRFCKISYQNNSKKLGRKIGKKLKKSSFLVLFYSQICISHTVGNAHILPNDMHPLRVTHSVARKKLMGQSNTCHYTNLNNAHEIAFCWGTGYVGATLRYDMRACKLSGSSHTEAPYRAVLYMRKQGNLMYTACLTLTTRKPSLPLGNISWEGQGVCVRESEKKGDCLDSSSVELMAATPYRRRLLLKLPARPSILAVLPHLFCLTSKIGTSPLKKMKFF